MEGGLCIINVTTFSTTRHWLEKGFEDNIKLMNFEGLTFKLPHLGKELTSQITTGGVSILVLVISRLTNFGLTIGRDFNRSLMLEKFIYEID